jgi:hypothetical protein
MKMDMEHWWNSTDGRNYWNSGTLSATNFTWTDLGSNTGLRGKRMATDILSHGGWNDLLEMYWKIQLVPRSKHIPNLFKNLVNNV